MNYELFVKRNVLSGECKVELIIYQHLTDKDCSELLDQVAELNEYSLQMNLMTTHIEITHLERILAQSENMELTVVIDVGMLTEEQATALSKYGILTSFYKQQGKRYLEFLKADMTDDLQKNNSKMLEAIVKENLEMTEQVQFMLKSALFDADQHVAKLKKEKEILQGQYNRLKRRYDSYGIRQSESEYASLQQKYKETLQRLNNLRESRLGKLQIKYWDLRK